MFNILIGKYLSQFSFVRLRYAVALGVALGIAIVANCNNLGAMAISVGLLLGFGLVLRGISIAHDHAKSTEVGSTTVKQIAANVYALIKLEQRFPHLGPVMTTWAIEPVHIQVLLNMLDEIRPKRILELGCGVSTLVIAAWLKENSDGRLVSIEHSWNWTEHIRREAQQYGVQNQVDIRLSPLKLMECLGRNVTWYEPELVAACMDGIDFVLVDAPPAIDPLARLPAIPTIHSKLSPKAVVLLDDGNRLGEQRIIDYWLKAYPDLEAELLVSASGLWVLRRKQSTKSAATDLTANC